MECQQVLYANEIFMDSSFSIEMHKTNVDGVLEGWETVIP